MRRAVPLQCPSYIYAKSKCVCFYDTPCVIWRDSLLTSTAWLCVNYGSGQRKSGHKIMQNDRIEKIRPLNTFFSITIKSLRRFYVHKTARSVVAAVIFSRSPIEFCLSTRVKDFIFTNLCHKSQYWF